MKNVAIILAGGSGNRFRDKTPKQFKLLNKRRIIDYSINNFEMHDLINKIIIVCHKDWVDIMNKEYKSHDVIIGGKSRQESSFIGLKSCPENTENVLIHDAARPFISQELISNSINLLNKYQAINTSIYATDTVVIKKNELIDSIPDRDNILLSQTPQSFKYKVILKAHEKFKDSNASDDIQLVNKMNIDCYNYIGSKYNIKITEYLDLDIAETIVNNKISKEI